MKVLYDHQAFTIQHFGGVSKCFCELISNLPKEICYRIAISESNNVHLQECGLIPDLPFAKMDSILFCKKYSFKGCSFFYKKMNELLPFIGTAEEKNRKASVRCLKEGNFDVFHPTAMNDYFIPYVSNKPFVITIHDMMPELYPEYYGINNYQVVFKQKHLSKAAAIIAVSENTKNDIVRLLKVPEEKIHVIYHGGPDKEKIKSAPIVNKPYFLFVGTRNYYKNYEQTIVDFGLFAQKYKDVCLVCTGPEFNQKEQAQINNLNLSERVLHIKANDLELKNLYSNAVAFIFPSLYEGFGMPILEAFAYGCPVLLNKTSCFPEIAGDSALFFDSTPGESDLCEKLDYIYNNSGVRNSLIVKGYQRLDMFSWKKSAQKLADVYASVV